MVENERKLPFTKHYGLTPQWTLQILLSKWGHPAMIILTFWPYKKVYKALKCLQILNRKTLILMHKNLQLSVFHVRQSKMWLFYGKNFFCASHKIATQLFCDLFLIFFKVLNWRWKLAVYGLFFVLASFLLCMRWPYHYWITTLLCAGRHMDFLSAAHEFRSLLLWDG